MAAIAVAAVVACAQQEREPQHGVRRAQSCVPLSTIACFYACGSVDDGCGGFLDCGGCESGKACRSNVCACDPRSCVEAGKNCGQYDTSAAAGCGETTNCGVCEEQQACRDNVCECLSHTCDSLNASCGTIDDGCGGWIECGGCPAGHDTGYCRPDSWSCGCRPETCGGVGAVCGHPPDGCGGHLAESCGTCLETYYDTCTPHNLSATTPTMVVRSGPWPGGLVVPAQDFVCACVPTTCEAEQANCGRISDGCPGPSSIGCGDCPSNQRCDLDLKQCQCLPLTCEAQNLQCGHLNDGCSNVRTVGAIGATILDCGLCPANQVCNTTGPVNMSGGQYTRHFLTAFTAAPLFTHNSSCAVCPDGSAPDEYGANCLPCNNGTDMSSPRSFSDFLISATAGRGGVCQVCADISDRHTPNHGHTECICMPTTCEVEGAICGTIDDLCGTTLQCGDCPYNHWARQDHCWNNTCHCNPAICENAPIRDECGPSAGNVAPRCITRGATCGTIDDGCGTVIECGSCITNSSFYEETCTAQNLCDCVPTTCEAEHADCGFIDDRCGGTLQCGGHGYQTAACTPSACVNTIYLQGLEHLRYQPRDHSILPLEDGEGALTPDDLRIFVGDTVHFQWSYWDQLHVSHYFHDPDAECPRVRNVALPLHDPYFFGSVQASSSPPCTTQGGAIDCRYTKTFDSAAYPSLPWPGPATYDWPNLPVSSFEAQTPPVQWRVGTYCVGTARKPNVRATVRVETHACDSMNIGRGSPCDPVPPPSCSPDVVSIMLPELAPLDPVFANATCPEMKVLLGYLGVSCFTYVGSVIPSFGGDGTLQSLCPVTCDTCPREVVDSTDYSADPLTCENQNGTCLVQWKWPLRPDLDYCKLRRMTQFSAGGTLQCVDNQCTCSPTTCAHEQLNCGSIPDQCGGHLDCGDCNATADMACYDHVCETYRPEPEPEPEPEPISNYCAGTGRIFEYIETGVGPTRALSWEQAVQQAVVQSDIRAAVGSEGMVRGYGYLATINSAVEQACIELVTEERGWLGGNLSADGNWSWVTGEESEVGTNINNANWGLYDPSPGNEFLALNLPVYPVGAWRAEPISANMPGFFIEWTPPSPPPEPEPEPGPDIYCEAGFQPDDNRTACESCISVDLYAVSDAFGNGKCARCIPGSGPNADRTICERCALSFSASGEPCHPCEPGWQPNWLAGGLHCIHCSTISVGAHSTDGRFCSSCLPGQEPSPDRTQCLECGLYEISDGTLCIPCLDGMHPVVTDAWGNSVPKASCELMHAELTLNMNVDEVPDGGADRQTFMAEFAADFALLAGVSSDRVRVIQLRAGSLVVIVEVTPSGVVVNGRHQPVGMQPQDALINFQDALDFSRVCTRSIATGSCTFASHEVVEPFLAHVAVLVGNFNECFNLQPCAPHGACIQMIGSYTCKCFDGYEGVHCEFDINECLSGPCQNGGICTEGIPGTYVCACVAGYGGHSCESDIDECSSTPCQNSGNCIDDPCQIGGTWRACPSTNVLDSYTCFCRPGFLGDICEFDIDECLSHPCQYSAPCTEGVNSYSCACRPGLDGHNCNEDVDECESNPCANGGSCREGGFNEYVCTCVAGFSDLTCTTDVDECLSSPCRNGGVCAETLVNEYSCACTGQDDRGSGTPGFEGHDCELDVDECASFPCQNGAVCTHPVGRGFFSCRCAPGYDGDRCHNDIDECVSDPCIRWQDSLGLGNNIQVNCVDLINNYRCICEAGYSGHNCEVDIDECASRPCRNEAPCSDSTTNTLNQYKISLDGKPRPTTVVANLFICSCLDGWTGDTCNIDIDDCMLDPCVPNGLRCEDKVARFHCICISGWEGTNCESDIDECRSRVTPHRHSHTATATQPHTP